MYTLLVVLIAIITVGLVAYFVRRSTGIGSPVPVDVQSSTLDGKKPFTSNIQLPHSFNNQKGLVFSYACWVLINDFAYNYGKPKIVFTKGPEDLSSMCPALLLDGTSNSLIVKLDTFAGTESIPISNIPAKKWLHIAISADQDAVMIYVNGKLYEHHSITHMPRQNNGTVHTGISGGFDGKVSNIQYFDYLLTPDLIESLMKTQPKVENGLDIVPPYFATSWWTTHK